MKGQKQSKHSQRQQAMVVDRLGAAYANDFRRKASGHVPEQIKRVICTIYNTTLGNTGQNAYGAVNSAGVVNSTEFVAIANANIYRMFRVVAIRARIQRRFQQPFATGDFFGALIGCVGGGNNAPPNANGGMFESQGFALAKEPQGYLELSVDAGINPNAKLWSTVQAVSTVVADNNLWAGWRFTNSTLAAYNTKPLTDEFYEYDVEFRTS